jgi:hypothetical protein
MGGVDPSFAGARPGVLEFGQREVAVERAMRQGIAFAVFAGAVLAGAGALAACPTPPLQPAPPKAQVKAHKPSTGCVDLNGLPQISAQIVAGEPLPAPAPGKPSAPVAAPSLDSLTDSGLRVGLTKPDPAVRAIPTVGYHWSLD